MANTKKGELTAATVAALEALKALGGSATLAELKASGAEVASANLTSLVKNGKVVAEEIARGINRRNGMQIVSFRIGNIIAPDGYKLFPDFIHDPKQRSVILWSYIDARDIASACRLAIEKDGLGATVMNLAADETSTDIKSKDLLSAEFPEVKDIRSNIDEYQTLLSNNKAKKLLGWKPEHCWRDYVNVD